MRFTVVDKAVDWLKRNREEILVGTAVIIAGVAFVVAVAGSGGAALVLVPALTFASSEDPSMSYSAAVKP